MNHPTGLTGGTGLVPATVETPKTQSKAEVTMACVLEGLIPMPPPMEKPASVGGSASASVSQYVGTMRANLLRRKRRRAYMPPPLTPLELTSPSRWSRMRRCLLPNSKVRGGGFKVGGGGFK
eukprot:7560497-Pyramimonas_sp.AAC.1